MKLEIDFDENSSNLEEILAQAKVAYENAIRMYQESLKEYQELNKRWHINMSEREKDSLNAQAEAIERQWKRWGVVF